ncbi:hypothetical protein [Embleya sp. NPDC059237]|uniref:hypothetical protein n=1 Tax=Embleya sp. NPDC059237 TaxID=3346784 RepID=UPI0036AE565C
MNSTTHAVAPAWAHEHCLYLPSAAAATAAAGELADHGHLLVAARPAGGPGEAEVPDGWWRVSSLAEVAGRTREEQHWMSTRTVIDAEDIARRNRGFTSGGGFGRRDGMLEGFDREGLLHERPPSLEPVAASGPPPAPAAPPWTCGGTGPAPTLIDAARAAAMGWYGEVAAMPEFAGWLFDEDFFEEFGDSLDAGEFLSLLAEWMSSDGQASDVTAEAVPFVAALAAEVAMPDGARAAFLMDLLRAAVAGPCRAVALVDRAAALDEGTGESVGERAVRPAVEAEIPCLLARWDDEADACRLVLAALAAVVPDTAPWIGDRLAELDAPAGTRRADVVALVDALLLDDATYAIGAVAAWHSETAISAATPADRRIVALAVLPDLIGEELSDLPR